MGKHPRKRQRKDRLVHKSVAPLGTATLLNDDADKDDEERRLESLLFGQPFASGQGRSVAAIEVVEDEEEDGAADVTTAELEGVLDCDVSYHWHFRVSCLTPLQLFFVDDGTADRRSTTGHDIDVSPPEDPDDSEASGDEEQSEGSSISDEPRDDEDEAPSAPPRLPKSRKAPAWTDPDDASLEISLASSARLRKLRDAPEEDAVKGPEYERRLRRQFVKMNPTPEWAAVARRKRRRTEVDADAHADAGVDVDVPTLDSLDALVTSSGGILGHKRRARLDPGVLSIERLRDANQAAQAEGEVTAAQFHPSPQLSMLLVASSDRRTRLFNVRVWLVFSLSLSLACSLQ